MDGAKAVALVRDRGFVAVIEPVDSELPQGTVVGQDPPAGVRLEREAIITLRLAVQAACAPSFEAESEPALQQASAVDDDDTEQWYAALLGAAEHRARTPRRRRKHRRSRQALAELVFDPAPEPIPLQPPVSRPLMERARAPLRSWSLIASAVYTLPALVAASPWRRGSSVIALVLLFALIGTRFISPAERRPRWSDHRVLGRVTQAQLAVKEMARRTSPPRRSAPRARRTRRAGHARPRRARSRTHVSVAVASAAGAAPTAQQSRPTAADAQAGRTAPSAGGQFVYLGQ